MDTEDNPGSPGSPGKMAIKTERECDIN